MSRVMLFVLIAFQMSASLLGAGEYKISSKQLKNKNLSSLEKIAEHYQQEELLRAIHATQSLNERYSRPGISEKNFLQAAYYIETHLPYIKQTSKKFLTKNKTGVKNAIEYDSDTDQVFIVLDSKKAFIGRGAKKRVHKCIHYMSHPKVLARSEQSMVMHEELKAHKDLIGVPGIMNAHAFTTHKQKNKKYHTIYSDIYAGTLKDVLAKKHVSFRNKLIIMSDLIDGLLSLHSREYVHRDLHSHNYLYSVEYDGNGDKVLRAVIADLGRTIKISEAKGLRAQMTRRATAPEAFRHKRLKGADYFATDVYALGCIFYRLYYNKFPGWQKDYIKSHTIPLARKKALLIKKLRKATEHRRSQLISRKERNGGLNIEQDTELLVLKMLHVDPNQRATASELRHEFHHILHRQ